MNMQVPELPHGCTSWIVVRLSTGEAVCETYSETVIKNLNPLTVKAIPAITYLQDLNRSIREGNKSR